MRKMGLFCALLIVEIVTTAGAAQAHRWFVPRDFATIQEAVDSDLVTDGDTLFVAPGRHAGAVVTKALTIVGSWGAVIDSGPALVEDHPCLGDLEIGFQLGFAGNREGSGTTIANLYFDNIAFPVFGRSVDNITVFHNVMKRPVQGITNSSGKRWLIKQNKIEDLKTANGGGLAIFVGDKRGRPGGIRQNRVNYNTIVGTLQVSECDTAAYKGAGITLSANFTNGALGAEFVTENLVAFNRVSMDSDTPSLIDFTGILLIESGESPEAPVIFDNLIMLNDLQGVEAPFFFSPDTIADENTLFMNQVTRTDWDTESMLSTKSSGTATASMPSGSRSIGQATGERIRVFE